jgi:isopropylmalate/homocitrate/citramalate synthase
MEEHYDLVAHDDLMAAVAKTSAAKKGGADVGRGVRHGWLVGCAHRAWI